MATFVSGTEPLPLRAAVEDDIDFLLQLRRASMDPHLAAAGLTLTDAEHLERVRDRLDCAQILLVDSEPAGLIKMTREPGHWHIMQLQVAPGLHGRGIGGAVLAQVIDEARAAGAALTLAVLKANPAKRLYERMGFVVTGEGELEYEMALR